MSLFSKKEIMNLKLRCIPLEQLKELSSSQGKATEIIKSLLASKYNESAIDKFIKEKYAEKIKKRKLLISDDGLKKELLKVKSFSWGVVQGQLDRKIQAEYVRKIVKYEDLVSSVKAKLYGDITNYVICTWFNHWTTLLIEEHISIHPKVVPTIKNVKGIDIFFNDQPFDLKITYLPRNYNPQDAIKNPSKLAIWLYEHQGSQRFGDDNRFLVILLDKDNPERSWELKRDFDLVFKKIDNFFNTESLSNKDEIIFTFGRKTYTTITKVLIITK